MFVGNLRFSLKNPLVGSRTLNQEVLCLNLCWVMFCVLNTHLSHSAGTGTAQEVLVVSWHVSYDVILISSRLEDA